MKKSARVLNVARGGIIDEKALADALAAGTIAGAGVDVFTAEPHRRRQPAARRRPNVVLTPHLGASRWRRRRTSRSRRRNSSPTSC